MFSAEVATSGFRGNGQDPGRTQRTPASAFFCVDSFDRTQGANQTSVSQNNVQPLNNFTIQKRQTFVPGFFHRIGLTEVRFPFGIPNINEYNNQMIVVDASAVPHTITVPEGFYSPSELATELDTVITAAVPGQTWTITQESETATFLVVSNSAFQFQPFQYASQPRTLKGLQYMLNWFPQTAAVSQSSLPMPNMQQTAQIDICSRSLTQFQQVKDNSTRENQAPGLVCRLYLNNFVNENVGDGSTSALLTWPGCRPQMIHRNYPMPKFSAWQPGQFVDSVDIQLQDDAGDPLQYPDNVGGRYTSNDFQLTFILSEN